MRNRCVSAENIPSNFKYSLAHGPNTMRSFSFRKTTEGDLTEKQSSPVSHESQAHVHSQNPVIKSPSVLVQSEHGTTMTNPENSRGQVQPTDEPVYPHGFALATITVAVAVSVFLVALVRNIGSTR